MQDGFGDGGEHSIRTVTVYLELLDLHFPFTGTKQGTKQVEDRTNPHECTKTKDLIVKDWDDDPGGEVNRTFDIAQAGAQHTPLK
jgi:hypothetical protein